MKVSEVKGRPLRIISEPIGDPGLCSPARTKVVLADTGEMIEGVCGVKFEISRRDRHVVRATIEVEVAGIDVIADLEAVRAYTP